VTSKLAIVTGGSSGIGRHLVGALAAAGYAVAFSYRASRGAADLLLEELHQAGARCLAVQCDAGSKSAVDSFYAAVADWHGGAPNLLVNNAGVQTWSSLLDLPEERWDEVIRTNLKGCFLNTQAVARMMQQAGHGGTIVNIGSGCNKLAFPRLVDYSASKGGIERFTKVAAIELGPLGITVNCVAPGAIAIERTALEAPDYASSWSAITPLGRIGTPADVSGVVLFFSSPAAAFVTGQTIWVDGGVFTRASWPSGVVL
jgi:3-oxoacyl-[acyl-carrier protein] reductase